MKQKRIFIFTFIIFLLSSPIIGNDMININQDYNNTNDYNNQIELYELPPHW